MDTIRISERTKNLFLNVSMHCLYMLTLIKIEVNNALCVSEIRINFPIVVFKERIQVSVGTLLNFPQIQYYY